MALPTRRVFNTLTDEKGQPQAGVKVRAQLLLPKSTRRYQSEVLPIEAETITDIDGYWFLDLVPTDIFDDEGAFYWIIEGDHMHKIKLPSGADPVWIYDVIVPGDMDAHIVRELLPMVVTSIRVADRAPLKGDIELRAGTEITLEQDYAEKAITIHGRRIVGEQGIIVTPRLPYDRVVTPDYGTEIQPVAASSSAGTLDRFARVDHIHEGVHSLNGMVGDVVIEATQGLRKVDDAANKKIILKSTHAIYLTPNDFVTWGSITKEFFPWRTGENVTFRATTASGNDVTEILTDNNYNTFVAVNSYNSIFLSFEPYAIYAIRFYVSTVRQGGQIGVIVQDAANNTIAWGGVLVSSVGWYEVVMRAPPHGRRAQIIASYGEYGEPYGGYYEIPDVDVAEVRLERGIYIPALFTGVRWAVGYGYREGIIQSTCFLFAGWKYRYKAWFGNTDDAATAKVEGRLYDETGLVTIFRPLGGLGTGISDQIIVLSGDLLTPTQSKFYLIEWLLISDGTTGTPGGDPHFLGMLIEFE